MSAAPTFTAACVQMRSGRDPLANRDAAVALNPDSKAPKDAKVLSKPFHLRDLVNEVEKLLAA